MSIADEFLNNQIKLEMSVEDFSQLMTILVVAEVARQKLDAEDAHKAIEFMSGYLAALTAVVMMPDGARKSMLAMANKVSGDKIKNAVREAAKESEAKHNEREAVEKAKAEAEHIIKEAMEGK